MVAGSHSASAASAASQIMSSSSSSEVEDCTPRGFGIFGQSFYQAKDEESEPEAAVGPSRKERGVRRACTTASAASARRDPSHAAESGAIAKSATIAGQDPSHAGPATPRKKAASSKAPTPVSVEKIAGVSL